MSPIHKCYSASTDLWDLIYNLTLHTQTQGLKQLNLKKFHMKVKEFLSLGMKAAPTRELELELKQELRQEHGNVSYCLFRTLPINYDRQTDRPTDGQEGSQVSNTCNNNLKALKNKCVAKKNEYLLQLHIQTYI